jgi:hypothetical protein
VKQSGTDKGEKIERKRQRREAEGNIQRARDREERHTGDGGTETEGNR